MVNTHVNNKNNNKKDGIKPSYLLNGGAKATTLELLLKNYLKTLISIELEPIIIEIDAFLMSVKAA